MQPTTVVLLHSPLTGAAAWGRLPETLRGHGLTVVVPEVTGDDQPPFAGRYVALTALQVAAALGPDALPSGSILVGHSGAGPLLPQVGFARRSAHDPVRGYVFLDAGLPRPGSPASRLELFAAEGTGEADALEAHLREGGRFPEWSAAELEPEVPDASDRALLQASLRPRPLAFFAEPLPAVSDWPDAPCGYLRTSPGYAWASRLARGRGWPVVEHDRGHFAALSDPAGTAAALLSLIDQF